MMNEAIRQTSERELLGRSVSKDHTSSVIKDIETVIMGAAELHAMLKELTGQLRFVLSNRENSKTGIPEGENKLLASCDLSIRLNEAYKSITSSQELVRSLFTNLEI